MTQQTPKRSTNRNMDKMVLQDSRSHADNQLLFWAKDAKGYTTDINQAHLFTQEEAMSQQAARTTDIPHKLADIRAVISATVDRECIAGAPEQSQGRSERRAEDCAAGLGIPEYRQIRRTPTNHHQSRPGVAGRMV